MNEDETEIRSRSRTDATPRPAAREPTARTIESRETRSCCATKAAQSPQPASEADAVPIATAGRKASDRVRRSSLTSGKYRFVRRHASYLQPDYLLQGGLSRRGRPSRSSLRHPRGGCGQTDIPQKLEV